MFLSRRSGENKNHHICVEFHGGSNGDTENRWFDLKRLEKRPETTQKQSGSTEKKNAKKNKYIIVGSKVVQELAL